MKLKFEPKYFLKCVLTDSVNKSIWKKIDFGLNGPDRVTYDTHNYFTEYDDDYKDETPIDGIKMIPS